MLFFTIPALPTADQDREETNSVAVHTSVGASSGSEVSLGGNERERLELPREQESLNDSVRRLQLSVQEHCPEQLQLAEKVCNDLTIPPLIYTLGISGKEEGVLVKLFPKK